MYGLTSIKLDNHNHMIARFAQKNNNKKEEKKEEKCKKEQKIYSIWTSQLVPHASTNRT